MVVALASERADMAEQCCGVTRRNYLRGRGGAVVLVAGLGSLALALAAGAPSVAAASPDASSPAPAEAASPVQTWAGGYQLKGRHSSLSLRVSGSGDSPSIKANMLIKGVSDVALTDVTWRDGEFRGKLKEEDGIDSFDGRVIGNQIVGTVAKGGSSGPFRLIRLGDASDAQLRSIEGAYRGHDGTYLLERLWVGHWMINMAEERSGQFRGIFPVGPGHFVAGPLLLTPTPVQWDLRFGRNSLAVKHAGKTDLARKVPLRSEDISFTSGGVRLAGTLVEPESPGPHPAIVFMHGSGAAPRQSNFGLGYWLAAHGFAVLKYDKRGSGESGGDLMGIRYEELGDDGAAAARWLSNRPEIDPKRIGFWGISEGGWTAPLAATRFRDAAFVIIASGGGISPAAGELLDTENQLETDGRFTPAQISQALDFQRLRDSYMRSGQGWDAYAAALKSAVKQPWWNYPSTDLYGWSKPDSAGWKMKAASYFYDPAPTLRSLHCPILILFGALDTPAGVRANLAAMHQALAGNRAARASFHVFPETSHNLFIARSGNENDLDETTRFSPDYFPTITNWLLEQVGPSKRPSGSQTTRRLSSKAS
jgi:dienelactone hydrolase